jgi:hypothetical protein
MIAKATPDVESAIAQHCPQVVARHQFVFKIKVRNRAKVNGHHKLWIFAQDDLAPMSLLVLRGLGCQAPAEAQGMLTTPNEAARLRPLLREVF